MVDRVQTVRGPIGPDEMDATLVHEHALFAYPGYTGDVTLGPFDHDDAMDRCVAACGAAQSFGIRTIIDATPNECGRDPLFLSELSERTGLNIICSGWFRIRFTLFGGNAHRTRLSPVCLTQKV